MPNVLAGLQGTQELVGKGNLKQTTQGTQQRKNLMNL